MHFAKGKFQALRHFIALMALLVVTFALGWAGISAARALFVLGCIVVSIEARRHGAPVHLQTCIVLFCIAPLLRRVVDLNLGYEESGLMLTGPFLAILVPAVELRTLLRRGYVIPPALRPLVVVGACAAYAGLFSVFNGDIASSASGTLKWVAPLLYGAWLHQRAGDDARIVAAATQAFMIVMPPIGIYGIVQYIEPPAWDRYWMIYTPIWSIGLPEPYAVRVFSTMNSPASYATFTCCALLLIGICRTGWAAAIVAVPCSLGFLLSLYRTAWVALALGLVVCLLSPSIRRRASWLVAGGAAAGLLAAVALPFGDVIANRFETFGQGSGDYSAEERLGEYTTLLDAGNGTLLGHGFAPADVGQAGALSIDGQVVACWYTMGLPVGLLCLAAIAWAFWQAISRGAGSRDPARAVLGAVMASMLVQIPLASIASGEMGFLFWVFVGIASARNPRPEHALAKHHPEIAVIGNTPFMSGT